MDQRPLSSVTRLSLHPARLYGILDTGYVDPATPAWEATCRALLEGGVDVLQLRAKHASAAERAALLERILPLFAGRSTPLIINDDLALALSRPGLGLHVGQEDLPVEEARAALGPDRVLGLSTHSPAQAARALEQAPLLDYFAVGPVFATPTKPTYTPVGLALVSHVAALAPRLPWFCIGGLKTHHWAQVAAAGGQRAVVVSDLLQAADVSAQTRAWRSIVAA
jgi:thiamine-phosphate pyrophosphorylase